MFASLFAPRLAEAWGWHAVFGMAMAPIAVVFVLFAWLAKDAPSTAAPRQLREYGRILRQRDALWMCVFYAVTFGGFVGLASYMAIFLRDEYALSKIAAGDLTAACVFGGSFARPVGGFLADRLGGARVLTVLFGLVAAAALTVASMPPLVLGGVALFTTMALLGMGNGAVFQLVSLRFSANIGTITGLVGATGGLGGFALPLILGLGRESTGQYTSGFIAFAAAALLASIALAQVGRAWRHEHAAGTNRAYSPATVGD